MFITGHSVICKVVDGLKYKGHKIDKIKEEDVVDM